MNVVCKLEERIEELCTALAKAGGPIEGLVGHSAAMQEVFGILLRAARVGGPLLITGEPGTGKSAAARALHGLSRRRLLTLGTLTFGDPDSPVSQERACDAVRQASGGTLLIEAVDAIDPAVEHAMAVSLAERPDVALVATSRWSPAEFSSESVAGRSLFERLSARIISLPSLRDRRDDIPFLAEHFLAEIEAPERGGVSRIDSRAMEALEVHPWPGNVRELRNVIGRACALSIGPSLGLTAIQSVLGGASAAEETRDSRDVVLVRVGESMADVERRLLARTLEFARGNKRKAAEILKLSLKTIYNKIKEYGLEGQFRRKLRKERRSG